MRELARDGLINFNDEITARSKAALTQAGAGGFASFTVSPSLSVVLFESSDSMNRAFVRPWVFLGEGGIELRGHRLSQGEVEELFIRRGTTLADWAAVWGGWHFPKEVITGVFEKSVMTPGEEFLLREASGLLAGGGIISSYVSSFGGEVLIHEFAHALWHQDQVYRSSASLVLERTPARGLLAALVKEIGYPEEFALDEMQAYLLHGRVTAYARQHGISPGEADLKSLSEARGELLSLVSSSSLANEFEVVKILARALMFNSPQTPLPKPVSAD